MKDPQVVFHAERDPDDYDTVIVTVNQWGGTGRFYAPDLSMLLAAVRLAKHRPPQP